MMIVDTKDIAIDRIVKFPFQSRFDKEKLEKLGINKEKIEKIEKTKKEKIEEIANSFEKSGLLNSIIVREYNGKYQLIAGDLRLRAFQLTGKKEISAKIIEANDFEARVVSFVENYHRHNLLDIEEENDIYDLWIDGKELYFNNNKSIMSKWTGIPYDTLLTYLQAGEERDKENQKKKEEQSKAIINATANDLKETRVLEKIDSEIRKELLKAKIEDNISHRELRTIVKTIKIASEKNTSKEVLTDIVKLVSEKKLNPYYVEDFVNTITQIPIEEQRQFVENVQKEDKVDVNVVKPVAKAIKIASEKNASKEVLTGMVKLVSEKRLDPNNAEALANVIIQVPKDEQKHLVENIEKEEKVDIYKVKNFVDTYVVSPPDIQKKLMANDIDIKEAKAVSKFKTQHAREQVLEERKIITDLKEKELEKHTNIRIKQEEEVEQNGDRKLGNLTKMDIEKIIKEFEDSDDQVDNNAIEDYRNVTSKIKKLFNASTVKNMHIDKNKRIIIEFIWQVYVHCYELLLEIGEIKIIGDINPTNPIPPKKLYGQ